MPKPRKTNREVPARVELRENVVHLIDQLLTDRGGSRAEFVHSAILYYLEHAIGPPYWPPRKPETRDNKEHN